MKWWREAALALCIAVATTAGASAVDVRDRLARVEADNRQQDAVKAAEAKAEEEWRALVKEDLHAIKTRLGVP